jgi:hypothetical protein
LRFTVTGIVADPPTWQALPLHAKIDVSITGAAAARSRARRRPGPS